MAKLDTEVFVIRDGHVVAVRVRDLDGFIEETTTPAGVGPRYHLREHPVFRVGGHDCPSIESAQDYLADCARLGCTLESTAITEAVSYEVWRWDCNGSRCMVSAHDSPEAATEALEDIHWIDFERSDLSWFYDRASADDVLRQLSEEDADDV